MRVRERVFDKHEMNVHPMQNNNIKTTTPETAKQISISRRTHFLQEIGFSFRFVYSFASDTFINFILLIDQVPTLSLFMRIVCAKLSYS